MKRIFAIILSVALLGGLGFLVYMDLSEHGTTELTHYIVHILVCITFCTLFHDPAHRFIKWLKKSLGFKPNDHDCHK